MNELKSPVNDNNQLNSLFGKDWNIRFLNENGDFCYVMTGTFTCEHRKTTVHELHFDNGTFRKTPVEINKLKITFVRGDSNLKGFKAGVHLVHSSDY